MPEDVLEQQSEEQLPIIEAEISDEDVQIDLEPSDGDIVAPVVVEEKKSDAEAIGAEKKDKPRKRNSAEERISRLTKENADAVSYAMELQRERDEAIAIARQAQEKNKFLTEASIASYEKEANDKLGQAKADLKRALDSGDTDAAVDAQERLAEAKALQGQVATYKVSQRGDTYAKATPAPQTRQPQAEQARRNPVADSWIQRNDWVDNGSENFNAEKAQDALAYAENLASELKNNGRGAEIGTQRYFREIDRYLKETWEEAEEITNEAPPAKRQGSPVAAQTRGPALPAKPEQQRITLSPAEQQVAIMMGLRDQNGNPLSREEHFKAYARSKLQDARHSDRDAAISQRRQ